MPRSSSRRVVVTGLGIVSPVGIGLSEAWANITAGKSGIAPLTRFDATHFTSKIAGEVKNFDVGRWLNAKEARRFDNFDYKMLWRRPDIAQTAWLRLRIWEPPR